MRLLLAFTLALAACSQTTPSPISNPSPGISGTIDSNVLQLRSGMTQAHVTEIIGAHQHESFDAADGSTSCRSYLYDETIAPKFVHACFQDGFLATASDGHPKVYEHPGDTF